jgi:hypothetical protein
MLIRAGFQLVKTPQGRILRIADLVDDDIPPDATGFRRSERLATEGQPGLHGYHRRHGHGEGRLRLDLVPARADGRLSVEPDWNSTDHWPRDPAVFAACSPVSRPPCSLRRIPGMAERTAAFVRYKDERRCEWHGLDELRSELDEFAEPEKKGGRSLRQERIIAGFEEIQRFLRNGRAPQHGEDGGIFERMYAVRLDRLRALEECLSLLASRDHQRLLSGTDCRCDFDGDA